MKDLNKSVSVIIGGGDTDLEQVSSVLSEYKPDLLIAADSGLEVFDLLGMVPDHIIGDFDSLSSKDLLRKYEKLPCVIHSLPCEKDYTDMKMACDVAVEKGAGRIVMLGATGSRLDHMLGNILLLWYLRNRGVEGVLINSSNRARCLDEGVWSFSKKDSRSSYISFLPVFGLETVIGLKGFKYDAENLELNSPDIITLSNEWKEEFSYLTVKKGRLLVLESSDTDFSLRYSHFS